MAHARASRRQEPRGEAVRPISASPNRLIRISFGPFCCLETSSRLASLYAEVKSRVLMDQLGWEAHAEYWILSSVRTKGCVAARRRVSISSLCAVASFRGTLACVEALAKGRRGRPLTACARRCSTCSEHRAQVSISTAPRVLDLFAGPPPSGLKPSRPCPRSALRRGARRRALPSAGMWRRCSHRRLPEIRRRDATKGWLGHDGALDLVSHGSSPRTWGKGASTAARGWIRGCRSVFWRSGRTLNPAAGP